MLGSMKQLVPSGHEKPLRQAFYTAAAILFTVAGCTAAVYVYYILEIFIKPLIWALLCGSFLFHFKYSVNLTLRSWLQSTEEGNYSLIAGAFFIPFTLFDAVAEVIGLFTMNNWKILFSVAVAATMLYWIQLVHLFQLAALYIYYGVIFVWVSASSTVELFAHYRIVLVAVFGVYIISVLVFEPSISSCLRFTAVPAWLCLFIFLVSFAGNLQVPLGIALFILVITGVVATLKQKLLQENIPLSMLLYMKSVAASFFSSSSEAYSIQGSFDENVEKLIGNQEKVILVEKLSGKLSHTSSEMECSSGISGSGPEVIRRSLFAGKSVRSRQVNETSTYFNFLFFAFFTMMMWMHMWLLALLAVPFLYWCLKQIFHLKLWKDFIRSHCRIWFGLDINAAKKILSEYYEARRALLLPPPTGSIINIIVKGDRKLNAAVLDALPTITSTITILILIVGSISISIFFVVKIQQESLLLVQMTSDLINETVSKYPEFQSWLPDNEGMQNSMDSIVDKIYQQGRESIKNQLHSNFGKEANVTLIEKQALKIWDHAYHLWFNKSVVSEKRLLSRHSSYLQSFDGGGGLFSGVMDLLNMSEVIGLLKENMTALMSILETLWSVMQINMSLIFSSVTTVLTVILSGGTAVLNFVLSTVVFFTALFYLLVGSDEQYMPVKLIEFGAHSSLQPSPIATSIQDAISGVFGASLKMASFYGLYTWLNHTALGTALVYIPSLLATVFSVIPILTTYWACIPSFLELWLLKGDLFRGVVLILLQFLPTMFVDAAIYREMTASGGGHPYITGLAVAGGLYYFGLEGAIIGPIVLCILLVAVNVYLRIINMPDTEKKSEKSNAGEED